LVNDADAAVDVASDKVKAAKAAAVKLQKATYKAERTFKAESDLRMQGPQYQTFLLKSNRTS